MFSSRVLAAGLMLLCWGAVVAFGCGGFFCQAIPIDQAGEQIVFRQEGDQVTAMVLIQYQGDAKDFSWVVPVPGIPEFAVGSDLVFPALEQATRAQFRLDIEGAPCPSPDFPLFGFPGSNGNNANGSFDFASEDGVQILKETAVGPFDIVVVTSDDPEAMAIWLKENDYDLTERGSELIAPYVADGMNFVAVRLQQNQGVGDIKPLIMRYDSDQPMVPIRLTAVAAMPDMGVLVWLLGESRAVPLNYLHVEPNWTRFDWFNAFGGYAQFQDLITEAMDMAGGQGFATEYAGRDIDYVTSIPNPDRYRDELARYAALEDDAAFVVGVQDSFTFPQDQISEVVRRALPLPEGTDPVAYRIESILTLVFTKEELAAARDEITNEIVNNIITPLMEAIDILDDDLYMTRFYTTLSPEEMTLDPVFSFNPDLPDQPNVRRATLEQSCSLGTSQWDLRLGEGTGRDGELVIRGVGDPFEVPPTVDQPPFAFTEELSTSGQGKRVEENEFEVLNLGNRRASGVCGLGMIGPVGIGWLGLGFEGRRRRLLRCSK